MITRVASPADPAAALQADAIDASSWSAGPGTVFAAHRHASTKRLFVVAGEITFDGLLVRCGEGIRIDAGTRHSAVAGDDGVTCVEGFEARA